MTDADPDEIDKLIVSNLQSLMEEKGLKPTPLSLDAGLSRTAVRDILRRKSRSPSHGTLVKLANAAGVDVLRLTVGPNWEDRTEEEREILDVLAKLSAPLRRKLIGYGQGLLDGSD